MSARFTRSLLTAAAAATTLFSAGALAQTKSDFNNDGKADLVWRHQTVDSTVVWYMNGASALGSANFVAIGSPDWQVGAVGDINGDGAPDILWRHRVGGNVHAWNMGAGTNVLVAQAMPTVADLQWQIAGIADFNWDGRDDIVWRHYGTGQNVYWTTTAWSTYASSVYLPTVADTQWYLGGVADFDNNGYPDLVWHHNTSGQNVIWMMGGTNGTTYLSTKTLPTTAAALRPEAVADFTGDGCIDIAFRNSGTGANELWRFDCAVNRVGVSPISTVDTGWKIGVH